jgi:hypothetical protein
MSKEAASLPLSKLFELYERSLITISEFSLEVFQCLSERNVYEFLEKCPSELRWLVAKQADRLPADDDDSGWTRFRVPLAVRFYPLESKEYEAANRRLTRQVRSGVAVFRMNSGIKGD